jgi:Protein of unknown function (DUF1761)
MVEINYSAVVVAALSGFAVGALWYGPLFGKQWMAASGVTEADIKHTNFQKIYGITFVMSVIAAFVLARVIVRFDATTARGGIETGLWMWLGFVVTVQVTDALFNRGSLKLVAIDSGYRLVWAVVMGVILAVWR